MKRLLEPYGTLLLIPGMHCAWWRRKGFLHLYICAHRQDQEWQGLWQHWLLPTCLMEGELQLLTLPFGGCSEVPSISPVALLITISSI